MSTLAAYMPKSKETKRVEAHLMPDKYAEVEALAKDRQWSVKRMTENIILWYLESLKKNSKKAKSLIILFLSLSAFSQDLLTITKGGKFTGTYNNIQVYTYDSVEISNSVITGTIQCFGGTKLYIHHNTFNGRGYNRALDDYHPISLTFEYNTLNRTGGLYLDHSDENTRTAIIRYNYFRNSGKLREDGSIGPEHRAAILFNTLDHPVGITGEIAWNKFENLPDSSLIEDNINIGNTIGKPLLIHDNYIYGAYPYPASKTSNDYSGSGITVEGNPGQAIARDIHIYNNQVISTCNAGININSGIGIVVENNTIVTAGKYANGKPGGFFWAGGAIWQCCGVQPVVSYKNNSVGYIKSDGTRQDFSIGVNAAENIALPNPITLATEEAELVKFEAKLKAAGISIGAKGTTSTVPPVIVVTPTGAVKIKVGGKATGKLSVVNASGAVAPFKKGSVKVTVDNGNVVGKVDSIDEAKILLTGAAVGASIATVSLTTFQGKVITKSFNIEVTADTDAVRFEVAWTVN